MKVGRGETLVREERSYSSLTPDIREHDHRRRRTFMLFLFFSPPLSFLFILFRSVLIPPDSRAVSRRALRVFSG